jgi:preprotein translocase subunit YajC
MNDTTDMTTLTLRMVILVVIAGIFYFVLKSKKEDKK